MLGKFRFSKVEYLTCLIFVRSFKSSSTVLRVLNQVLVRLSNLNYVRFEVGLSLRAAYYGCGSGLTSPAPGGAGNGTLPGAFFLDFVDSLLATWWPLWLLMSRFPSILDDSLC